MTASLSFDPARHAWRASSITDLAPAVRRAKRHSRVVRLLRRGIPIGAVTVVVLYLLAAYFNPFSALSNLPSIAKMVISGTKLTMDAPKLAGYTRDGRSYELTAAAASQDLKKPQFIELKGIRAKVEMRDGNVVTVTADDGLYDTKAETVVLRNNVRVNTSNGTEARLVEAAMDMRKSHVVSDKPVEILLPNGRLDAQQMEVSEAGAVTVFGGGVSMVLRPDDSVPAANRTEPRR